MNSQIPNLIIGMRPEAVDGPFFAINLGSDIAIPPQSILSGFWLSKEPAEPILLREAPPVSFEAIFRNPLRSGGPPNSFGARYSESEHIAALQNFLQRQFLLYIENRVSDSEIPLLLAPRPCPPAFNMQLSIRLSAVKFWDFPDVRLQIAKQRMVLRAAYDRLKSKHRPLASHSNSGEFDPVQELEEVARNTSLEQGLYLPVSLGSGGTEVGNSYGAIRLDSKLEGEIFAATLISDRVTGEIGRGTTLVRRAFFDHLGNRHEDVGVIGTVL